MCDHSLTLTRNRRPQTHSCHHEGKSSSPKTISSSSSSSSGKRPFLRKKLFDSRIIDSRILRGKMFFSESVLTRPVLRPLESVRISPPWRSRTFLSHSLQSTSPCFDSGTYAQTESWSVPQEKIILPISPEPPLRSS